MMNLKMHMDLQDVLQIVIVMDGENVIQHHINVKEKQEDHQLNSKQNVTQNYSNIKKKLEEPVQPIVNVMVKENAIKKIENVKEPVEDLHMNLNVIQNLLLLMN